MRELIDKNADINREKKSMENNRAIGMRVEPLQDMQGLTSLSAPGAPLVTAPSALFRVIGMRRFIVVISILIVAIIINYYPSSPPPVLSREPLKDFPARIGDWTLVSQQKMSPESLDVLKVDDYIMRTYENGKGQSVSLYIGYFKTQKEGKTNHSPRQCLAGSGWYTISAASVMLPVTDALKFMSIDPLWEMESTRSCFYSGTRAVEERLQANI